jgi:L-fucose mutarotase/ribose pyranase (RbsD/FucU family)
MLRGTLPTPDRLKVPGEMGHGDEIAIVDANDPVATYARRLVRLPGA